MHIRLRICSLLFMISAACLLTGCGDKHFVDLEKYVKELKHNINSKAKMKVPAPIRIPTPIIYQAESKRAPFVQTEVISEEKAAEAPLMAYPLNVLRFVGTMTMNGVSEAYVMTPDNMVYQVKVGDTLGDRNGKVVKILPNQIDILQPGSQDATAKGQIESMQLKDAD